MSSPKDRIAAIRTQTAVNGIDFVEIGTGQTTLIVHFINPLPTTTFQAAVTGATITGGDAIPTVAVQPITSASWVSISSSETVLELVVAAPGDFSNYTLTLTPPSASLDPFYSQSVFSFKAGCPTTVDCEPPAPPCPPPESNAPPIEYLAKDYQSFRGALLDFSTLRYPAWQERSEGDFGVMFAEALSSVADDLSYLQDRIAAEAYIATATERRSLVRLARLMSYEPMPATAATVMLQLMVASDGTVPAGTLLSTQGPDGAIIPFETGTGITDTTAYPVRASWSVISPYWLDDSVRCLLVGATELWVAGNGLALQPGQQLLIDTAPAVAGDPHVRELVTLATGSTTTGAELLDPLFGNAPVTHLTLTAPLQQRHDLTRTTFSANLVPAIQGQQFTETFYLDSPPPGGQQAIVRTGPNGTTQYLYTLGVAPLAYLAQAGDPLPQPEIRVSATASGGTPSDWGFRRSILDAGSFEQSFTLDPMRYVPVGPGAEYDGDAGDTMRFGDGSFGVIPDPTSIFTVTYRSGGGVAGNVAAGAGFTFASSASLSVGVTQVTNPFAATGGNDPESDDSIRRRAPYAYRNNLARAPLAADYERYAEQLPWVQRASTSFRFTGSWLTAFTTPDPIGTETLSVDNQINLLETLDRVRMAGRDSQVRAPVFKALDIKVVVCAKPDAFRGDVESGILAALSAAVLPGGAKGFFHPDNFTFGDALCRGNLEAAVQAVPGVHGVVQVFYRARRKMGVFLLMDAVITVAPWEIIQVDSNPSRPERGIVQVVVEGGK